MNGTMLIPLLGLILLVVSPFAKVPRGVLWAAGVLALIVIQVTLGLSGATRCPPWACSTESTHCCSSARPSPLARGRG